MANIPGISGYVQPGTFARDRVISRGVSIPGGVRIACIMGEGLREETIIESAHGSGLDGSIDCAPDGNPAGRYFKLQNAPVISGRTELYLNGTLLRGVESPSSFDSQFDYQLDIETGCIELQTARIEDQDGKKYSASSLNVGNGVIASGTCGDIDLISILDLNAPDETWTARAVGIVRDSLGNPIPGKAVFTLTGSVSGQVRDSGGNPILFHSSYYTGSQGAISGTKNVFDNGYVVATSDDFGLGSAYLDADDQTVDTTNLFQIEGNVIAQGQVLVGDTLVVDVVDGYASDSIEITDMSYDSGGDITTLTLKTDSMDSSFIGVDWSIKAGNIFIDDVTVDHDGITGLPVSAGSFKSSDVGKVLAICSSDAIGLYLVSDVTSSRRLRITALNSGDSLPELTDVDVDGIFASGLTFHLLETNGVLCFGIKEGTIPFQVGDKFLIRVSSKVLKKNDRLEARYIAEADINDPELFVSSQDLFIKHGRESVTNTLSLGARMAFENGAPAVLALQCKPAIARRTSETLIAEVNSNGVGGFTACGGNYADCEVDDLTFSIPVPLLGIKSGRPDSDAQVNIFVIRGGKETQIFPNKYPFYSSSLESPTVLASWITDPDNAYSYTITNSSTEIVGTGVDATLTVSDNSFSTPEINFNSGDEGRIIVITSAVVSGNLYTTEADIISQLGSVEFTIDLISSDNKVILLETLDSSATDVQFFIRNDNNSTDVRAQLVLHTDFVRGGTLKIGDGLKISYVDEKDSTFFDTNWFDAFEALEAFDCNMVVPLPLQNRSGIFQSAVQHCTTMSSIAIQKERIAMFGAQQGITTDALLGLRDVAIEDVGVLEGVQGDSVEEVLGGNTEDLVNYKLDENFTTLRSVYMYPDQIVRSINGSNTFIDGFYMAAAAAGFFSGTQNLAIPLTNKTLVGFTILRNKQFRTVILNALGNVGATVVQPQTGGGKVLAGRTTSTSGYVEDEEISVVFIRDRVKQVLRDSLRAFIGQPENPNTQGILSSRVNSIMAGLVSQELVTSYGNIRVERDKVDPRQWNIYLRFTPSFPINYIFLDIEVGIS